MRRTLGVSELNPESPVGGERSEKNVTINADCDKLERLRAFVALGVPVQITTDKGPRLASCEFR